MGDIGKVIYFALALAYIAGALSGWVFFECLTWLLSIIIF